MTTYNSVNDAKTALNNSGMVEWFEFDQLDVAAEWMFRNDATPEQAAKHFGVE